MQRVRKLIKSGLRASGWELRAEKSITSITRARPSRTRGLVVEFVGPSGIGKTTLCRQIAQRLRRDWFFEHHAAALVRSGKLPSAAQSPSPVEAYLGQLHAHRLGDLATSQLHLVQRMKIVKRMSDVVAQGAMARLPGQPRGFILDDGVAHFFAEAMLAQSRERTRSFTHDSAFIFLLPPEFAASAAPAPDPQRAQMNSYQQRRIYRRLHDFLAGLGCPLLLLSSADKDTNPELAQDFIAGIRPP